MGKKAGEPGNKAERYRTELLGREGVCIGFMFVGGGKWAGYIKVGGTILQT